MAPPKIRAVVTSLALVAGAGLFAIASTSPAQSAESAKATAPVPVSISKRRVITMPTVIQPGVNQFDITTAARRSDFQLALPVAGYTAEEAARDIEKGLEQGKVKQFNRFEDNVTLAGGTVATADRAGTLMVTLAAGTYFAIDTGTNDPSKFFQFTVAGADTGNVLPASEVVKAKQSTKWAGKPASIDNKGLLTFTNASSESHFVEMARLKKGQDVGDFKRWLLNPEGPQGPPPVDFTKSLSTGVVSPGVSMTTTYRLPKGNYVMICFWPMEMDGELIPHAFMGMIRGIKLK